MMKISTLDTLVTSRLSSTIVTVALPSKQCLPYTSSVSSSVSRQSNRHSVCLAANRPSANYFESIRILTNDQFIMDALIICCGQRSMNTNACVLLTIHGGLASSNYSRAVACVVLIAIFRPAEMRRKYELTFSRKNFQCDRICLSTKTKSAGC